MSSTRPQIYRLMVIDREIRAGRFPNSIRLSRALDVSPRTIRRDLETLRDSLGAPLEFDPVRNGYLYSERSFALPPQRLTEGDLLALLAADAALAEVRGTSIEATLRRILDKLPEALPAEVDVEPRELGRATRVTTPATDGSELVATAPGAGRRARPGRSPSAGFVSLKPAPGGEPATAAESPVEVHLRFAPALAPALAEHDWPEGSRCQFTTDGGVDLTLMTEDVDALLRWTLGWGAGAQVISPPWIRRRMRETVRRVLLRYSARTGRPSRAGRSAGSSRKVFKPPSRGRRPHA